MFIWPAARLAASANHASDGRKRDAERARLESDLTAWLTECLREMRVSGQGPPIEIPDWAKEQIARGVVIRVSIESCSTALARVAAGK